VEHEDRSRVKLMRLSTISTYTTDPCLTTHHATICNEYPNNDHKTAQTPLHPSPGEQQLLQPDQLNIDGLSQAPSISVGIILNLGAQGEFQGSNLFARVSVNAFSRA
jgi:hypothetical protein